MSLAKLRQETRAYTSDAFVIWLTMGRVKADEGMRIGHGFLAE